MTKAPAEDLIHGHLDGTLAADRQRELAKWLGEDPAHARQFAAAAMLHDRLRNEWLAIDDSTVNAGPNRPRPANRHRVVGWAAFAAVACLLVAVGLTVWQGTGASQANAAIIELERLIDTVRESVDRTYLITAGEQQSRLPGRGVKPPIDGAMLYVRSPASYVLVRHYADDAIFVTGSDGMTSWAVPPRGPVHISSDPQRFRGAVAGQQHAIPFLAFAADLENLRDAYDLEALSGKAYDGLSALQATRKPETRGGPKVVTIWYDAATGVIRRMRLDRLPQARGGPSSVTMNLVDQARLDENFFRHATHHDETREVIEE